MKFTCKTPMNVSIWGTNANFTIHNTTYETTDKKEIDILKEKDYLEFSVLDSLNKKPKGEQ